MHDVKLLTINVVTHVLGYNDLHDEEGMDGLEAYPTRVMNVVLMYLMFVIDIRYEENFI